MNTNLDLFVRIHKSINQRVNTINPRLTLYKEKYTALVKYFNNLSRSKQINLIDDLRQLQAEYIIQCAQEEQVNIEIAKLGRIRIKPCKKEVLRIKDEGRRAGESYEETAKKIATHVRAYKVAKKNQVVVVKPKFKPNGL